METTPDAMTTTQMDSLLGTGLTALERAERALATARSTYDNVTNRGNFETEEAHRASFAEHARPLRAAEEGVLKVATTLSGNARLVLRQLEGADRPNLTPDELAAAGARAVLVRDECERAPLPALAAAMRGAIAAGDRPGMFLYERYARERLAAPTSDPGGRATHPDAAQEGVDEVRRLAAQMRDALRSTAFDPIRGTANQMLSRSSKAKGGIELRRRATRPILAHDGRPKVAWPNV